MKWFTEKVPKALLEATVLSYERALQEMEARLAKSIALSSYEVVVGQLERQVAHAHRMVDRAVAREVHDAIVANLTSQLAAAHASEARARDEAAAVLKSALDIKRHEMQMSPEGFDPRTLDAEYGLGERTKAAIDEWAGGDREVRNHLIAQAHLELSQLRSEGGSDIDHDKEIARRIKAGDSV